MRYLSLIPSFSVALAIKLFSISNLLQKPALAIATLRYISSNRKIARMYKLRDQGAFQSTASSGSCSSCILSEVPTLLVLISQGFIELIQPNIYLIEN